MDVYGSHYERGIDGYALRSWPEMAESCKLGRHCRFPYHPPLKTLLTAIPHLVVAIVSVLFTVLIGQQSFNVTQLIIEVRNFDTVLNCSC